MAGANGGLSNHVKDTCRSRGTLIKAQLSALNVATERGTSDMTEATHFSQCVHDQQRRLEAEDCDSIRCAQLISGGRRRMRPPQCLAHARPTMCCIHLVIMIYLIIIMVRPSPARRVRPHEDHARSRQEVAHLRPHACICQLHCQQLLYLSTVCDSCCVFRHW